MVSACGNVQNPKSTFAGDAFGDGIIGGKVVASKSFIANSTVAVYNIKEQGLCTGTLLGQGVVITAAHCIGDTPADLVVLFNSSLNSPHLIYRQVDQTKVHESWASQQNREKNTGDIALVHFLGDLPQGFVAAELLKDSSALKNGKVVLLAGYGLSDGVQKTGSGVLRQVEVSIADTRFSESEVSLDQRRGKGACHGDSGGPAYIVIKKKAYLFGLTSRGSGDQLDHCDQFSVYTKTLAYSTWISESSTAFQQ